METKKDIKEKTIQSMPWSQAAALASQTNVFLVPYGSIYEPS